MILVTGGTGLVGSHLLYHLLLKNDSVKAIHQPTSDLLAVKKVFGYYTTEVDTLYDRIVWVEADLNDIPELEIAFKNITHVYHCAAFISFDPKDYKKMRRINIDGTTNIVNQCILNSVNKLCFVSSVATLERDIKKDVIDESENWDNTKDKSGYAITKYGAEKEVWRASQEGVDMVIVNPGVILGSGFWTKGSSALFFKVKNGFPFYTEGVTGFVDVIDVVQIMQKLMRSEVKNERFILVSENITYKDLFFQIADALHVKRPKLKVSKTWSEIIWRLDKIKSTIFRSSPVITKYSSRSSQSKKIYSSNKIKLVLDVPFNKIDQTILRVCKDLINN
ncbi:MAG: SDR family oxidoreductase [Flavobacteriaceae bacterium]|nr:SDR family oxidoreductase [Flavobacteriaceae bacterium]